MDSKCIDVMLNHRSIRKYKHVEIDEKNLKMILEAVRRAPSGWGLGWINVISVRDNLLKSKIAELVGGQEHVREAPLILVFVIDYARLRRVLEKVGLKPARIGLGFLLAGLVDVGIASTFAAIAAESLGYGVCYIVVYSAMCEVAELLGLPRGSIPIVGLTIGVPDEKPGLRPRASLDVIVDDNIYGSLEGKANKTIKELKDYMMEIWKTVLSENGVYASIENKLIECLRKQGFNI